MMADLVGIVSPLWETGLAGESAQGWNGAGAAFGNDSKQLCQAGEMSGNN